MAACHCTVISAITPRAPPADVLLLPQGLFVMSAANWLKLPAFVLLVAELIITSAGRYVAHNTAALLLVMLTVLATVYHMVLVWILPGCVCQYLWTMRGASAEICGQCGEKKATDVLLLPSPLINLIAARGQLWCSYPLPLFVCTTECWDSCAMRAVVLSCSYHAVLLIPLAAENQCAAGNGARSDVSAVVLLVLPAVLLV